MGKYEVIGIIALLILVVILPVYALTEPYRMDRAQDRLQQQYLTDSTDLYLENCAKCHGVAGAGSGVMPALSQLGQAGASHDMLFSTIAHSPHGTTMAAWHVDEGGSLNAYQVEGLVTLILHADWSHVGEVADARGVILPAPEAREMDLAVMEIGQEEDPHECRSCHEEPEVHADRFGLNCSRCHTLSYWKPALLLRHTFLLDHGGEGNVACQTCHTRSYAEHTCYECHDHDPEGMQEAHRKEGVFEFDGCAECHPTGQEGEAASLGYGRSGEQNLDQGLSDDATGQGGLWEFHQDQNTGQWGLTEFQAGGDSDQEPAGKREDGADAAPEAEETEGPDGDMGRFSKGDEFRHHGVGHDREGEEPSAGSKID